MLELRLLLVHLLDGLLAAAANGGGFGRWNVAIVAGG